MKVKKVLSLVLAVVMIFTMIPAQLILSNANKKGYPTEVIGNAVKYNTDVTLEKDGDYEGLVKVAFQASVNYPESYTTTQEKSIVTLEEIVNIDTSVLEPVNYDGDASILSDVQTNAGSAPAYAWVVDPETEDIALYSEAISAIVKNKPVQKEYSLALTALSYNDGIMYIHFVAQNSPSGYVWATENEFCTVGYMYFKLAEGKKLSDVKGAVKNATEEDLLSDTACRAATFNCESVVSTQPEPNRFVSDVSLAFSSDFDDPAPAQNPKITFNWKAVEEGTVVDKTTGAVEYEEGAPVTAPANSENDYSTDEFDYEFTGWSPELAEGATATEDTIYTAQYQKKAVDKEDLNTEYSEDKGLVQEDYEEKVPGAWDAFQEALTNAKSVLENQDASKVDVAEALAALEAAMANLTPKTPAAQYNITFSWQKGAQSNTKSYAESAPVSAPEGSEADYVSADGKTNYRFAGWKDDATGTVYGTAARIPAVTGVASYTAQYTPEDITVKITFDVNGTKTEKEIPYGDMVTLQDAPVVEDYDSPDGDTHYTFKEWSPAFVAATEPATYTAQFESKQNDADYATVTAAKNAAQTKIDDAGNEYNDMYTEASRTALANAINAVQWEPKLPHSQQQTVENWAQAIVAATEGLTLSDVKLTFITHESPSGIEKTYKYGDNVTDIPELQEYTDEAGFKWTPKTGADAWSPAVPATAKVAGIYTAQYTKEDVASLDDLQTAVANAIAKRGDGTQWTDDSVAALDTALAQADAYPATREYPASAQDDIDRITANINTAAANLTPKGATQFDVTFNWKGNNGEDKSDTTQWANGATPTAPQGAEDGYETTDYTYSFMRWEPSIVAVDGANQSYTAIYNDPQPKSATKDALAQAIAAAQAKQAETNYADKYTDATKSALATALQNGQTVYNAQVLPSQQGTVDQATQAINDALSGMTRNEFTLKFYTHDNPNGITQQYFYGDPVTAPEFTGYSETDHDYTPKTGADAWDPAVPATATANGEYTAQYQEGPLKTADYRYNDIYSALAQAVVDTPNADKVYTQNYLAGVQDALNNNVQPGLPASQQQAVDDATQALANAISDPQYINYTIRFINEGQVISTSNTYHYDDTVTVPANPTKDPTAAKTFEFNGWTPEVTKVTGDQDYTAKYTENDRYYTVTYNYHGGTSTEAVKYGDTAQNPPTVPTYYEGGIKYTFDHWNAEFAPVEGPQEYTAVYAQEQMPAVTVTFRYATSLEEVKDGHLTEEQQTVPYGDMPVVPDVQSFVDGDTTYKFDGWDPDVVAATEEATYTAIYTPVTEFTPDMSEIEALVARYNQMVKTGKYNKDDLKAVKAYIDEIYDTTFTSQDEVNEMAKNLKALEDACRRIDVSKKETKKRESYSRRYSRTARTGDNATLVVMSVILVSSLGIAFISLKKRRENI